MADIERLLGLRQQRIDHAHRPKAGRTALMEHVGLKLRLIYYEASDGPRLVMFGPIDADFRSLQELFVRLSQTPGMSCELAEQSFIAAFGGVRVLLSCSAPLPSRKQAIWRGIRNGLDRVETEANPVFEWRLAEEDWDDRVALLAPLVTKPGAGHQYLDHHAADDAIVVVSKGEYGDEMLAREQGRS